MAPNPNKPYRVCDSCFNKLKKAIETDASSHSSLSRRGSINQELNDKDDRLDSRSRPRLARFSSMESLRPVENHSSKHKKLEFNSSRVSPIPTGSSQWGALKSFNPVFGSSKKFFSASVPGSRIVSRATSPVSRRPSPPRSTTPTPTLAGLSSPKIVGDDAQRTNDSLNQEVTKLRAQVESLTRKAKLQEVELERTCKQLKEAIAIAGEESSECKAAKEVIKSLTAQLKDMAVGGGGDVKFVLGNGEMELCGSKKKAAEVGRNNNDNNNDNGDDEWVEQDEPGVYITLTSLPGGIKDLKRVRFSRKRFSEKEAEQWWAENRGRVYQLYKVRVSG